MIYPEEVVKRELMWEYDYTEQQASSMIESYKAQNKYTELCDLIKYRMSVQFANESLCHRIQG